MALLRILFGLAALVAFVAALNFLVIREDPFVPVVYGPAALGIVCGAVWLILTIILRAGTPRGGATLEGLNTVFASAVFLAICVMLYAFAAHWNRSWDLTQEGRRELSPQTAQVLDLLREDVNVLCLFPQSGQQPIDTAKEKTRRFLEQCQLHTSRLQVEFADPYKEEARLKQWGVTHASPKGTLVLRCGARQKTILLTGENPRLEERDFTNALINVIREKEPTIGFLTGHGEHDPDSGSQKGGSVLKQLLDAEGYKIEKVAIAGPGASIPSQCDMLIINGLESSDLAPQELDAIAHYLDSGGRLFVLLEPWIVRQGAEQFRPWLAQRYGIAVGSDIVISGSSSRFGELVLEPDVAALAIIEETNLPKDVSFDGCYDANHPITRGFNQRMVLSGARSVALASKLPEGIAGAEILRTLPDAWAETDLSFIDPRRPPNTNPPKPDPDEIAGSVSVAVAATLKTDIPVGDSGQTRSARIVVIGDVHLTSDQYLAVPGNLNFVMNTFAWLTENEELIAIRPTGKHDPAIVLTPAEEHTVAWIPTLGILQLVVISGLVVYARRRKHR